MNKILIKAVILIINIYKYFFSPLLGNKCRFLPSCSDYASEAIASKGVIKGGALAIKRLTKCHPWGKSGYDPVIKQKKENIL